MLLLKSLIGGGGGALLFIIISVKYGKNSFLAKSRADNIRTDMNSFTFSLVIHFLTGEGLLLRHIGMKQDHLRMNNSTGSNNHLRSIDRFRSMINDNLEQ